MKKNILKIFKKCWFNACFSIIIIISTILFVFLDNVFIQIASYCLLFATLLMLLLSIIYNIIKRKWVIAFFSFLLFMASAIIVYVFTIILFFNLSTTPDNYADNINIPKNAQYYKPLDDNHFRDSLSNIAKNEFEIYKSFQPGIYNYAINTDAFNSGIFYLKAFEITKKNALSKEKLSKTSVIQIKTNTSHLHKSSKEFVIYEGDWGKPYIARFEVWYKDEKSNKDSMIMCKNYIIEGWQR